MKKIMWALLLLAANAQAAITNISGKSSVTNQDEQISSTSNALWSFGQLLSYEDVINTVARVEGQFSYSVGTTTDLVVKAFPGYLHTLTCGSDAAATAGSLTVRNSAAAGSGDILFTWTFSTTEIQPRTIIFDTVMSVGITLDFTTTADVTCTVSYR